MAPGVPLVLIWSWPRFHAVLLSLQPLRHGGVGLWGTYRDLEAPCGPQSFPQPHMLPVWE